MNEASRPPAPQGQADAEGPSQNVPTPRKARPSGPSLQGAAPVDPAQGLGALPADPTGLEAWAGLGGAGFDLARVAVARTWLHDLRNPLTAVIGGLAVALNPPPGLDEARREALLAGALASARLADAWVQDLGDWCRVQGGEPLPPAQNVALEEVVLEAIKALAPVAEAKGVAVHLDTPLEGLWVRGEAGRFGRVVMALLHRAIRGAKGPVAVRACPDGPGLMVSPGMNGEDPQLGHARVVAHSYGGELSWTAEAFVWRMAGPSA